jgi:hypothetical protein
VLSSNVLERSGGTIKKGYSFEAELAELANGGRVTRSMSKQAASNHGEGSSKQQDRGEEEEDEGGEGEEEGVGEEELCEEEGKGEDIDDEWILRTEEEWYGQGEEEY